MPILLGIKCGLQTLWCKKDKRIYSGITVPDSNKVFHESLYSVVANHNPDMNII